MPQYGTWFSYTGSAKLILAIVLLAAAAAIVVAGAKLQLPARLPRPRSNTTPLMIVAWAGAPEAAVWLRQRLWPRRRPAGQWPG